MHYAIDLNAGMEDLASESFDVVVYEQVLEHLKNPRLAMAEISRVTKPGGIIAIGIPTFPLGIHWVRKHVVPMTDRIFGVRKIRSHIQALGKSGFVRELKASCPDVTIVSCRGFRIVSGGVVGWLENYRWWWRLNRLIGQRLPSLYVEIRVLARKRPS